MPPPIRCWILCLALLQACGPPLPPAPPGPASCESPRVRAARLALRAFEAVGQRRREIGPPIDPRRDPARTGLIGLRRSPVTTVKGSLAAKQTTVNPNWAAVIVDLLQQAGVGRGDRVAAGLSGSFPALNIAALAALQTLGLEAVVVTSVGASQYGANVEGLLWPDIERLLTSSGVLRLRSQAMSLGGRLDRATRLKPHGRGLLRRAIRRHGATLLQEPTYEASLTRRMAVFDRGGPVKAYVNVGGGTISVGSRLGKLAFAPGLNRSLPPEAAQVDSVMTRFARRDVAVIHLIRIKQLARAHSLPQQPRSMPGVQLEECGASAAASPAPARLD